MPFPARGSKHPREVMNALAVFNAEMVRSVRNRPIVALPSQRHGLVSAFRVRMSYRKILSAMYLAERGLNLRQKGGHPDVARRRRRLRQKSEGCIQITGSVPLDQHPRVVELRPGQPGRRL